MNTPLIDAVVNYIKENNTPFSMPGHKNGKAFDFYTQGLEFSKLMFQGDLTEVDGLDNLYKPEGPIKESLELLSEAYKAKKSYFLVNGSTSGNLTMIFSAFNEGDKILVDRGCHKSVFNGIIMRKLNPIYMKTHISKQLNMPLSIKFSDLKIALEDREIKGIVLTYPTYYGITYDIKAIINLCKEKGIKVLVDCAHGAHFGFNDKLPMNPIEFGADMAVMSAHKTLPSLTQTAYLHLGDDSYKEKVDFYVGAFSTTSPSYMFMMSLEYARAYTEDNGIAGYNKLIDMCDELKKKIKGHSIFKIVEDKDLDEGFHIDPTRIIINCARGYSGHKTLDYLRTQGIQAEMSDNSNVVLIPSLFSTDDDLKKIYESLIKCDLELIRGEEPIIKESVDIKTIMKPYEAVDMLKTDIDFTKAAGKISGENITPYPPGIPLVMMGEEINEEVIELIKYYKESRVTVLGLNDNLIKILKL